MLNLAGELKNSLVNGPGLRYVIFVQGCSNNCFNCQNLENKPFINNLLISVDDVFKRICENIDIINGVTFSGGEPFTQAKELYELGLKIKKYNLSLMIYTGFTYEEIINSNDIDKLNLLSIADIVMDGRYEDNNKSINKKYRGSDNQRMLYLENSKIIREE